jgi:hypothetical protein
LEFLLQVFPDNKYHSTSQNTNINLF